MLVLALLGLMVGNFNAMADAPAFPVPDTIYTALSTPFNAALTWVIGAIGVLVVIGWILKAVRRK